MASYVGERRPDKTPRARDVVKRREKERKPEQETRGDADNNKNIK